jgi:protein-tyrosine phosphatase
VPAPTGRGRRQAGLHPIQPRRLLVRPTLYTVDRDGPGRLATMAKPRGDDWLDDELRALRHAGVDVLVCALPDAERREVGLAGEPAAVERAGLEFVAIPIADRSVPDLDAALPRLHELVGRLHAGAQVVTHCRFGIGRASLLAAAVLVLEGVEADEAWRRLTRARGQRVPDTDQQRQWIASLPTAHPSA